MTEEPRQPQPCFKDGGVYLITGGAGGLGRVFAKEIARTTTGAVVVLTGRSAPDGRTHALLAELGMLGLELSTKPWT